MDWQLDFLRKEEKTNNIFKIKIFRLQSVSFQHCEANVKVFPIVNFKRKGLNINFENILTSFDNAHNF